MQKKIQNIRNHILSNAYDKVISRGKQMRKSIDALSDPDINMNTQTATFRIMGTFFYTVIIQDFLKKLSTTCTCPYDWGGLCKHQVAALFYLADYLERNMPEEDRATEETRARVIQMTKRNAGDPYILEDFIPLKDSILLKNASAQAIHSARWGQSSNKFPFKRSGSSLSFTINDPTYYWNRSTHKFTIQFKAVRDRLETQCSCRRAVKKLCVHQVSVLWNIIHNYDQNFFEILDPNFLDIRINEMAQKTGIPRDQIEEYFTFKYEDQKFHPKSNARGLINYFDKKNSGLASKKITQHFDKKDIFVISSPILDNEKALAIGYVFSFQAPNEKSLIDVIPITGVPTETPYLKYIKNLSSSNLPLELDDKDEEALATISEITEKVKEINYFGGWDEEEVTNSRKFLIKKLEKLFPLLIDKPHLYYRPFHKSIKANIRKSDIVPLSLSTERANLFFKLSEEDIFYTLKAAFEIGDKIINLSEPTIVLEKILPSFALINHGDTFYLHQSLNQGITATELKNNPVYKCVKKDLDPFFNQIVEPIAKHYPLFIDKMENIEYEFIRLKALAKQLYITELANFIIFKPVVRYDNDFELNIKEQKRLIRKRGKVIYQYERDKDYEKDYLDYLFNLHPEFKKQQFSEFFFLPFPALTRNNWFFKFFGKLQSENIEVFGISDLKNIKYSPYQASVTTHIKSGEDWFDVNIKLSFGEENVKLSDIKKAVMRNERFVKLSDGKLGILPDEWFYKLQKYFRVGELQKGEIKISKLRFSIIDELFDQIDDRAIMEELLEKQEKLKQFQRIENISLPPEITANLRDYQKEGYNWLNFLDNFQWGGILADDMGLGKTLQILTFLQQQAKSSKATNLVIVPTTLLFNWENEIKKFAPKLKFLIHHGPERHPDHKTFANYNIIISTYGVLANDIEKLKKYKFNYIILDESQAIKNPTSKRYKAACLLRGNNKVAMTGTPIENNTFDLYAQMNFLNPGFLGSQQSFKTDYSKPIDKEGDSLRAAELQRLVKPFILRRTKEQVAKELPPKVEDYLFCTMDTEQRKIYDAYRNKYRDYLQGKIEEEGLAKSKMYVLEGLMKLRQICDSPELLSDLDYYGHESIKIKELLRHITQKTRNHKILIFSQFVKMLKLIQKQLDQQGIKYEYLDGKSSQKSRKRSVETFQENESIRVFLISLKAGGTGLNLTAADYVYIVDPWWNPAVETQAIDRTHRIGQDKNIIAYRMICKNTVEEKIINYQKKKLKIASDIIHTDESFMKKLTTEDITDLFA